MRGRKFLFDNSFDEAAQNRLKAEADARARREAEALANTPPTFTVEELEAAKAAAYQQGRQDGMTDALGGIEQQISLSFEAIINRLPGVFGEQRQHAEELQRDAFKLCQTIMRKLAPALLAGRESEEVERVVRDAFAFLTDQPKVIIRVPEDVEPHLRDKIVLMASRVGYEGEVVLVGDPELDARDCRVSWNAGAVESALAQTWQDIDAIIARAVEGDGNRGDGDMPDPATKSKTETEIET
ncbi:MAG: hypothetical protein VX025_05200 [Pseudomonadota bacterium]|nr:hypothetical protein [Pseudomonadota bacterium]